MKNLFLQLFFFLLCSPVSSFSQNLQKKKIQKIESLLTKEMTKQSIPGLSVAIVKDKALIWSNGYGMADLENYVPARAITKYRTASVGKTITATAIMQLAEKGKLDLDAPIQQYCPYFPKKKGTITTRQLLTHQSGIRHYDSNNYEAELYSTKHYESVVKALDIFKDDLLLFEPGMSYQYSTYGFNVLGCIIEGASSLSFMEYLDQYLFKVAGMQNTLDDNPFEVIPYRAKGYTLSPQGKLQNSRMVDMSNKLPAGGYLTTAEDLVLFARAIMNEELLSKATVEQMFAYQKLKDGTVKPNGLGWGLNDPGDLFYGYREIFHGGRTPQVSTVLLLLPEADFAVAILANLEGVSGRMGMAESIAKIVLDLDK